EGVYDDPNGGVLREELYPRLRKHFQFQNEKKLFAEVAHRATFSLNIYSNIISKEFDSISNLFDPTTIDQCYESTGQNQVVGGIKDDNGNWNTIGHPKRIIRIDKEKLQL